MYNLLEFKFHWNDVLQVIVHDFSVFFVECQNRAMITESSCLEQVVLGKVHWFYASLKELSETRTYQLLKTHTVRLVHQFCSH